MSVSYANLLKNETCPRPPVNNAPRKVVLHKGQLKKVKHINLYSTYSNLNINSGTCGETIKTPEMPNEEAVISTYKPRIQPPVTKFLFRSKIIVV